MISIIIIKNNYYHYYYYYYYYQQHQQHQQQQQQQQQYLNRAVHITVSCLQLPYVHLAIRAERNKNI